MTIPDLPRSDKDEAGSTVYYSYKVEEINTSADYKVSYSTTNGVTSGLITMVNTKKPDKPDEPTYELPSTGSPGRHGSLHGRRRGHCAGRGAVWDITPGASGKGGKSDSCSSDPGNKPNVGKINPLSGVSERGRKKGSKEI